MQEDKKSTLDENLKAWFQSASLKRKQSLIKMKSNIIKLNYTCKKMKWLTASCVFMYIDKNL